MLSNPRKFKYKKIHRTSLKKTNRIKSYLLYKKQNVSLITKDSCNLNFKQIESVRKILSRNLKAHSKFSIYIFPDLPKTAKPTAMRMGKGKGNFKEWLCKIKAGTSIFKFKGISKPNLVQLLKTNYNKFPISIKLL